MPGEGRRLTQPKSNNPTGLGLLAHKSMSLDRFKEKQAGTTNKYFQQVFT